MKALICFLPLFFLLLAAKPQERRVVRSEEGISPGRILHHGHFTAEEVLPSPVLKTREETNHRLQPVASPGSGISRTRSVAPEIFRTHAGPKICRPVLALSCVLRC